VLYDNDPNKTNGKIGQGYAKAEVFLEQYGLQSCKPPSETIQLKDFSQLVDEQPESISEFTFALSEYISSAYWFR